MKCLPTSPMNLVIICSIFPYETIVLGSISSSCGIIKNYFHSSRELKSNRSPSFFKLRDQEVKFNTNNNMQLIKFYSVLMLASLILGSCNINEAAPSSAAARLSESLESILQSNDNYKYMDLADLLNLPLNYMPSEDKQRDQEPDDDRDAPSEASSESALEDERRR